MKITREQEVHLHLEVLYKEMMERKVCPEELDRQLGWAEGKVRSLFQEPMELLYGDLIAMLLALDIRPGIYFQDVVQEIDFHSVPFKPSGLPFKEEMERRLKMVEEKLTKFEEAQAAGLIDHSKRRDPHTPP